jgi:sulfide dehydrogenase cytochrome subunit
MRVPRVAAVSLLALAAGIAAAQGPDPNLARNIAANCANCHGTNGVSRGGAPGLAGVSKAEIVRKMGDYKSGRTPATIMPQLARGYTDEQIDLVAGWFAAQKP